MIRVISTSFIYYMESLELRRFSAIRKPIFLNHKINIPEILSYLVIAKW